MSITAEQSRKISNGRKRAPPSFFNALTGEQETISGDTEAAIILAGSEVRRKAVRYLDLLLDANPSKSDYDVITARAATTQVSNFDMVIAELESIVSNFDSFRDNLIGSGGIDSTYVDGMYPLLSSLTRGVASMLNRVASAKLARKINRVAGAKYASKLTDAQTKEWRSWKRVLLSYP